MTGLSIEGGLKKIKDRKKVETIFNKYGHYLIHLIPFALLTGPFFPDLFVSLLVIGFIYLSIKNKLIKYYNNKYFIAFASLNAYLIIISFFSYEPLLSLKSSLVYFRFLIFTLVIWYFIDTNSKFIKVFTNFLLITFSIALVDGYYQYLFNESMFGYSSKLTRLHLFLNDDLLLGSYIARLFPLLFGLILYSYFESKKFLSISFVLLILCDVVVYLSGERTSLALMMLSTIFIILFIEKYRYVRIFSLILSLLLIAFISVVSPKIKERNIDFTITQLGISSCFKNADDVSEEKVCKINIFSEQHHSMLMTSLSIFKDKLIFGSGPNTFRVLCNDEKYSYDKESCSTHPHNSLAQIMAELGTVGLILYFMLVLTLMISFIKFKFRKYKDSKINFHSRVRNFQICLFSCFLITIFPFLPTQNIFHNWINIIYFLPIGFFLSTLDIKSSAISRNHLE